MRTSAFVRLASSLAAMFAAAAWSAQQAPADAAAVLPPWAQEKLAAAKADPKAHEKAYKEGARLAAFCSNCHGASGQSVKPDVPHLAGQNTVYVLNQLSKFHDGRRKGAFFMEGLVKAMSNDELFAVAIYYTSQDLPRPPPVTDAAMALKGKAIYDRGCRQCHGDNGAGSDSSSRIAGQQPQYLDRTLRLYRDNGARADERMYRSTRDLTDADIKALVAYIGAMR